jgi:hypothetical protein
MDQRSSIPGKEKGVADKTGHPRGGDQRADGKKQDKPEPSNVNKNREQKTPREKAQTSTDKADTSQNDVKKDPQDGKNKMESKSRKDVNGKGNQNSLSVENARAGRQSKANDDNR